MKSQVEYLDKLLKENGLVIITAESGEMSLQKDQSSIPTGPISTGAALLSTETLEILKKAGEGSIGTNIQNNSHVSHASQSSSPSQIDEASEQVTVNLSADSVIADENTPANKKLLLALEKDTKCEEIDGSLFSSPSSSIRNINGRNDKLSEKNPPPSELSSFSNDNVLDIGVKSHDSRESTAESNDTKGSHSEGDTTLDQYSEDVTDALEAICPLDESIISDTDSKILREDSGISGEVPSISVTNSKGKKISVDSDPDPDEFFDAPSTPIKSPFDSETKFELALTPDEADSALADSEIDSTITGSESLTGIEDIPKTSDGPLTEKTCDISTSLSKEKVTNSETVNTKVNKCANPKSKVENSDNTDTSGEKLANHVEVVESVKPKKRNKKKNKKSKGNKCEGSEGSVEGQGDNENESKNESESKDVVSVEGEDNSNKSESRNTDKKGSSVDIDKNSSVTINKDNTESSVDIEKDSVENKNKNESSNVTINKDNVEQESKGKNKGRKGRKKGKKQKQKSVDEVEKGEEEVVDDSEGLIGKVEAAHPEGCSVDTSKSNVDSVINVEASKVNESVVEVGSSVDRDVKSGTVVHVDGVTKDSSSDFGASVVGSGKDVKESAATTDDLDKDAKNLENSGMDASCDTEESRTASVVLAEDSVNPENSEKESCVDVSSVLDGEEEVVDGSSVDVQDSVDVIRAGSSVSKSDIESMVVSEDHRDNANLIESEEITPETVDVGKESCGPADLAIQKDETWPENKELDEASDLIPENKDQSLNVDPKLNSQLETKSSENGDESRDPPTEGEKSLDDSKRNQDDKEQEAKDTKALYKGTSQTEKEEESTDFVDETSQKKVAVASCSDIPGQKEGETEKAPTENTPSRDTNSTEPSPKASGGTEPSPKASGGTESSQKASDGTESSQIASDGTQSSQIVSDGKESIKKSASVDSNSVDMIDQATEMLARLQKLQSVKKVRNKKRKSAALAKSGETPAQDEQEKPPKDPESPVTESVGSEGDTKDITNGATSDLSSTKPDSPVEPESSALDIEDSELPTESKTTDKVIMTTDLDEPDPLTDPDPTSESAFIMTTDLDAPDPETDPVDTDEKLNDTFDESAVNEEYGFDDIDDILGEGTLPSASKSKRQDPQVAPVKNIPAPVGAPPAGQPASKSGDKKKKKEDVKSHKKGKEGKEKRDLQVPTSDLLPPPSPRTDDKDRKKKGFLSFFR